MQIIITYIIISAAISIALRKFILQMIKPKKGCSGCHDSCTGCSLQQIKAQAGLKKQSQVKE